MWKDVGCYACRAHRSKTSFGVIQGVLRNRCEHSQRADRRKDLHHFAAGGNSPWGLNSARRKLAQKQNSVYGFRLLTAGLQELKHLVNRVQA